VLTFCTLPGKGGCCTATRKYKNANTTDNNCWCKMVLRACKTRQLKKIQFTRRTGPSDHRLPCVCVELGASSQDPASKALVVDCRVFERRRWARLSRQGYRRPTRPPTREKTQERR